MTEQKDGSSAEDTNWVKTILIVLNYIVGKGTLRKVGTGVTLWGIFTGDWLTVLVGLFTRLLPSITDIQKQRDAACAKREVLGKAVVKAAFDPDNPAQKAAASLMAKTVETAHPELKQPPSKHVFYCVNQARLNVQADDPQPGDIALVELADAMGI